MTQPTAHCIFVSPASKVTMPQLVRPCRLVVTSGTGIVRRYQPDTLNGERTRRRGPLHLRLEVSLSALNEETPGAKWRTAEVEVAQNHSEISRPAKEKWFYQVVNTSHIYRLPLSSHTHTPTHTLNDLHNSLPH